jgi:hypothetical protein
MPPRSPDRVSAMARQTLIFTVLPNGRTARNTLRLSIYLTPRLEQGATLADFPDLLHWPSRIQQSGLGFRLICGGNTADASANRGVLRPDVWNAIFPPETFVEPVAIPDYDQRLIVSYPVRDAHGYLIAAYQTIGTAADAETFRALEEVLAPLVFRDGEVSTLDEQLAEMRVTIWNEQHPPEVPQIAASVTPADTHDVMTRFALFHHMPPAPHRPNLPQTPADFAKTLDFHRALTALNSYPSLLRALGLVFDIEVPASLCPASPAGGSYGTIALAGLAPGFSWSIAPTFGFPATSYVIDATSFDAAPATAPADIATGQYGSSDVIGGLLELTPEHFTLVQVDLDGALLKALSLADAVAFAPDDAAVGDTMPALRSGGIALAADQRALQLLSAITDNLAFDQAVSSGTAMPRPLNARDLVRGYRIDIWSSQTGRWHSLHERAATYRFATNGPVLTVSEEEGFIQLAAAQPAPDPTRPPDPVATANNIPQPGTDLYLHERVVKWEGWSLSVRRPGLGLNRGPDPHLALTPDPSVGEPITPFKMVASFKATPGSLPQLRFGVHYRLRARAVDLAGNSVSLTVPTPVAMAAPPNGATMPYLRFEPVSPPLVVPRRPPVQGASLERLVIRSRNAQMSLDSVPTSETDERHIAPPRIAVRMAEAHGLLDNASGVLNGDANTYNLITTRDAFELPKQGDTPIISGPTLDVGYFPDPISRGAAFRNLPGTEPDQEGRIAGDLLGYATLPDVQPQLDSVTYIDFGEAWPDRQGFRLLMLEGSGPPGWDAANRVLSIALPKSAAVTVPLSSYLLPADLSPMGVWNWLREAFEAQQLAALQSASAETSVNYGADAAALITRLVLQGGHAMITPSTTLQLIHAVQQPLGQPSFEQLPVVHQPTGPILASALRNRFTPITAWRAHGAHDAVLLGGLRIHGVSSAKIDLLAQWLELTDDLSDPGPTKSTAADHVETIDLSDLSGGQIPADAKATRYVAVYIPQVDTLWFAAPFDALAGVTPPASLYSATEVAAPLHQLKDTKHRWIVYRAVATSRFQEYFPEPGLDFTRTSAPLMVDVPSSARPTAPDVAYVVPTFGWEQQETSNVKTSVRFGNGLRVYLNRPWFSSGGDELLGVVLWPSSGGTIPAADFEALKPYFTQWGNDPIWQSGVLERVPSYSDFPHAETIGMSLTVDGTSQVFDVAGHELAYDAARKLWFCDITFAAVSAYTPFVRLALARYQPHSVQGVELSRVVLADFAQIAPNRTAFLSIDPADPRSARLVVGGLGPQAPLASQINVVVHQRNPAVETDLGWELAPSAVVTVTPDTPTPTDPDVVIWSGTIAFATAPPRGKFRVVVMESELFLTDLPTIGPGVRQVPRLVYACFLPYDFPSTQPH